MGKVGTGKNENGSVRRGTYAGFSSDDEFNAGVTAAIGDLVADGFTSVPGSAQFLALSRSKVYEFMDAGELPYAKFGRSRRIPRRALIEFAAARLRGGHGQVS